MKAFIKSLLVAAIFCLANNFLTAQAEVLQKYSSLDYMKVNPGMHDKYLKLEKAWKKIHEANIKAGKYTHWVLASIAYPSGANEEYNYLTRIVFRGEKQLVDYIENWSSPDLKTILTPEELVLVNRTSEIRTLVKSEVWSPVDQTMDEDLSDMKVAVFNFFDFPETGSRSDPQRVEKEIWRRS